MADYSHWAERDRYREALQRIAATPEDNYWTRTARRALGLRGPLVPRGGEDNGRCSPSQGAGGDPMTAPDDAADPYADVWHQGRDCTYQCGLTGRTILAYHDDRLVVVAEDDYMRLRDVVRAAGELIDGSDITGPEYLWEEYADACRDAGIDVDGEDSADTRAALDGGDRDG